MKGVILAGGLGTRLRPLTDVINKHLLPVGSKPMLFWPIEFLVKNGFDELFIVLGRVSCGDIMRQLGNGSRFDAKIVYAYQEGDGGIADALKLAMPFVHGQSFPVVLGDNIFTDVNLREAFDTHMLRNRPSPYSERTAATVFLKEHSNPELFGVVRMNGDMIEEIIEKPKPPFPTNLITTGLYIYDETVWGRISALKSSARGEMEITDLNNSYAHEGRLFYEMIPGMWVDAGTPELYHEANRWAQRYEAMYHVPELVVGPNVYDVEAEYKSDGGTK